jgi:NADH-quinone oxidoreductase subunit C
MNLTSPFQSDPVVRKLTEAFPACLEEAKERHGGLNLILARNFLLPCAGLLRDDPDLNFNFLADITAVDRHSQEPRFEVIYRLRSIPKARELQFKVRLPGTDLRLDSVVPIWTGANAYEREVFDLFGIQFTGHPYLKRILMPEDWEGHPLRKDYPVEGYR